MQATPPPPSAPHQRRRSGTRRAGPILLAVLGLLGLLGLADLATGCSDESRNTTNLRTLDLITGFTEAGPSGSTVKLADLTTFEWTQAWYFPEGTSAADITRIVGDAVPAAELSAQLNVGGRLLVFANDGALADVLPIGPTLFLSGTVGQAYDHDTAEVVVTTNDPGPYVSAQLRQP